MTTITQQWTPLSSLGVEAVQAYRTLRARKHLVLPRPSRIFARIERDGKFTTATLRSGKALAVGVAARNPIDKESSIRGAMLALTRALKKMGRPDNDLDQAALVDEREGRTLQAQVRVGAD